MTSFIRSLLDASSARALQKLHTTVVRKNGTFSIGPYLHALHFDLAVCTKNSLDNYPPKLIYLKWHTVCCMHAKKWGWVLRPCKIRDKNVSCTFYFRFAWYYAAFHFRYAARANFNRNWTLTWASQTIVLNRVRPLVAKNPFELPQ